MVIFPLLLIAQQGIF